MEWRESQDGRAGTVETDLPGRHNGELYERMRSAITDGQIPPGAAVSQVKLAEMFGTSRTPLRPVLGQLRAEGFVAMETGHRMRVSALTPDDLEELYIVRVTLEAEALRLSVPIMTTDDIARLERHMAEMAHYAAIEDHRRWTVPHQDFHRALTTGAGPRVNAMLDQMFDHTERYRRLRIGPGPAGYSITDHRGILEACKVGDRNGAAALLATHLGRTALQVSDSLDPHYDPVLLTTALEDVSGSPAAPYASRHAS
jgi:DNA-binding GntR family transcriptional regulator